MSERSLGLSFTPVGHKKSKLQRYDASTDLSFSYSLGGQPLSNDSAMAKMVGASVSRSQRRAPDLTPGNSHGYCNGLKGLIHWT